MEQIEGRGMGGLFPYCDERNSIYLPLKTEIRSIARSRSAWLVPIDPSILNAFVLVKNCTKARACCACERQKFFLFLKPAHRNESWRKTCWCQREKKEVNINNQLTEFPTFSEFGCQLLGYHCYQEITKGPPLPLDSFVFRI